MLLIYVNVMLPHLRILDFLNFICYDILKMLISEIKIPFVMYSF